MEMEKPGNYYADTKRLSFLIFLRLLIWLGFS